MTRTHILAAGVALLLAVSPAFAQKKGGGAGGGGQPGGGARPGGGNPGGGPNFSSGNRNIPNFSGGNRNFNTAGIALSFGLGLANNLGYGGFGNGLGFGGYGGSTYRPNYYGNGFPGGGYYGNGYTGGSYYGNGFQPYSISPSVVPAPPVTTYSYPNTVNPPAFDAPVTQPPTATLPLGAATGLKITDLYEGTARAAGLRKGDIILKVDGTRTQSFEELRATLSTGKDKVVVEFIDGTSGETDQRTIAVDDTKIGVSVAETLVSR